MIFCRRLKQTLKETFGLSLKERIIVYICMILGVTIPMLFFRLLLWQVGGVTSWIAAVLVCLIPITPLPIALHGFLVMSAFGFMLVREFGKRKWEKEQN